jgi:hypothetical protein
MVCGRCGLQWDVADAEPPKCARTVDRRAIPSRSVTNADKRLDAASNGIVSIERRRAVTATPAADAWVDDTGRVKFRLGLQPFPGMKLYQALPAEICDDLAARLEAAWLDIAAGAGEYRVGEMMAAAWQRVMAR